MYISLHVQYRYYCQILMKLEFSGQIFKKYSNVKCLVGAKLFCADGWTDMTKL